MKKLLCALYVLFIMLASLPITAAASGGCLHENTVYVSCGGTHDVGCGDCGEHLYTAKCSGGESTCGIRATCERCGGEYGPIPLPHQSSGELDSSADTHFYPCINCGEPMPGTEQSHSYGNWYLTLSATEEREGERARECADCSYVEKEAVPRITEKGDNGKMDSMVSIIALLAIPAVLGGLFLLWRGGIFDGIIAFILRLLGR